MLSKTKLFLDSTFSVHFIAQIIYSLTKNQYATFARVYSRQIQTKFY